MPAELELEQFYQWREKKEESLWHSIRNTVIWITTKIHCTRVEGLAVYQAIQHFSFYLYGKTFTVIIGPLWTTEDDGEAPRNNRILIWALKLANYSFNNEYRPGRSNQVADTLSRCYDEEEGETSKKANNSNNSKDESQAKAGGESCGVPHFKNNKDTPPQKER